VIHVYGVVDGLDALPSLAGLGDAPLERRRVGELELVLSRPAPAEVSRADVLRHAEVVEELMRHSAAVLPAQLGRAFRDEDELSAAVGEQAPGLARRLELVRGCVEFGLRVVPNEPDAPIETESGAGYLQARLEQARGRERLVESLHEPLARLARATALHRGGGLNAAYLVARGDVDAFRAAAARLAGTPGATVVCTGPWPPYSFAAEEAL
jgi:hypothetical protein